MNPNVLKYALHPAALAVAAAVLTYVIMRLDCMACKDKAPKSTSVYCKNIAWVTALVGGAAYLLTNFAYTDIIDLSLEGLAIEPDF